MRLMPPPAADPPRPGGRASPLKAVVEGAKALIAGLTAALMALLGVLVTLLGVLVSVLPLLLVIGAIVAGVYLIAHG